MLGSGRFLALVAERAEPSAEADEGVVEKEESQSHQRDDYVEGKVELLVEFGEVAREEWEGHVELVGVDLLVGHQHPLPNDRAHDQHNRQESQRQRHEFFPKPLDFAGTALEQYPRDDISRENAQKAQRNDSRYPTPEKCAHEDHHVVVADLLEGV